MKIPEGRAQLVGILMEVHMRDATAFPMDVVAALGSRCMLGEGLFHAPCEKHACRVWQHLYACAYFSNLGCSLQDVDVVASQEDGDGGSQAAKAGPNDYDLDCSALDAREGDHAKRPYIELARGVSALLPDDRRLRARHDVSPGRGRLRARGE